MILPDLDPEFLYFFEKKELQAIALLSKYHHTLTQVHFFPLCYHLLKHRGYKLFLYKNTISLMKKEGDCMSLYKSPKLLLEKI
jgi:hypothetical protein